MLLSTIMDAIANELKNDAVVKNAYGWPKESIQPPCAVVGYPTDMTFDVVFQGATGASTTKLEIPVWVVVGKVQDKAARDSLSALLDGGAATVKRSLDGNLGGAVQTCRVVGGDIDTISVAGVDYLACRFEVEVYS